MKQETQTPDSKEGLHTQGEWFLSGRNRENDPLYINVKTTDVDNDQIEIPIAKLLPTLTYISEEQAQANAELIVKAVNEGKALIDENNAIRGFRDSLLDQNKKLLDSNRELLHAVQSVYADFNFDGRITAQTAKQISEALNNAKNI